MADEELERIKKKQLEELMKHLSEVQQGILDLNLSNFDNTISDEKPTLVDFWAEWCGPCKMMHPVFERLSKKNTQVKFARVNVDSNQSIAQKYGVQSIPTFIMFKNGQILDKMMGAVGETIIQNIIKKHI